MITQMHIKSHIISFTTWVIIFFQDLMFLSDYPPPLGKRGWENSI